MWSSHSLYTNITNIMVARVAFFHFFVLVTLFSSNSQWNDANKGASGLCIWFFWGAQHQYADTWHTIGWTLTTRNEWESSRSHQETIQRVYACVLNVLTSFLLFNNKKTQWKPPVKCLCVCCLLGLHTWLAFRCWGHYSNRCTRSIPHLNIIKKYLLIIFTVYFCILFLLTVTD